MMGLAEEELLSVERGNPEGVTSQQVLTWLEERGVKFSEATLRKYVQLGLLPHSTRVGRKGSQKGSQGVYPASIIRQIVEIKRLLELDFSIEQIKQEFLVVRGQIDVIEQKLSQVFEALEQRVGSESDNLPTEQLRRQVRSLRREASNLVEQLREFETRLSRRNATRATSVA